MAFTAMSRSVVSSGQCRESLDSQGEVNGGLKSCALTPPSSSEAFKEIQSRAAFVLAGGSLE
jgi:hypothetical protein